MRTSDSGKHWAPRGSRPQFRGTRDFCSGGDPGVAYSRGTTPSTSRSCASSARCPSPRCRSTSPSTTARPGRRVARPRVRRPTSTTRPARSTIDLQRQGAHRRRQQPGQPALRADLRDLHQVPPAADRVQRLLPAPALVHRLDPHREPVLSTWSHTAIQPDNPGGNGTGSSANQFPDPVVQPNGTLDVGFVSENCNDSFDPHLLFQRSTDGGQTFLPSAVQIDKPGQYADFMDGRATTHCRRRIPCAEHRLSGLQPQEQTTLLYVYQNNINRPTSRPTSPTRRSSDGGMHWSNARSSRPPPVRPACQQRPVLPVGRSGREGSVLRDLVRPPARPRERQTSTRGRRYRRDDAATFSSEKISTRDWNPTTGSLRAAPSSATTTGSRLAPTRCTPSGPTGETPRSARPASARRTYSPASRKTPSRRSTERSWPGRRSPGHDRLLRFTAAKENDPARLEPPGSRQRRVSSHASPRLRPRVHRANKPAAAQGSRRSAGDHRRVRAARLASGRDDRGCRLLGARI